jgi:hypothetical protein
MRPDDDVDSSWTEAALSRHYVPRGRSTWQIKDGSTPRPRHGRFLDRRPEPPWTAWLPQVNYHSPPTEVAVDACTNFLNALPYLIPCAHCAYDLGQFIRTNANKNGLFDSECGGATTEDFDESLCLKPEEACKSQRTLVSFFVRAALKSKTGSRRDNWIVRGRRRLLRAPADNPHCGHGVNATQPIR